MATFNFGIVGTGFIAGAIADAIAQSQSSNLAAVASRKLETAEAFCAGRNGAVPVEGWRALFARDDIDAVYVATPTVVKEEIALAAVAAGKHILVDKPFMDSASVRRMSDAASANGRLYMDATHFVHNPRTAAIRAAIPGKVGTPLSLATAFYFPIDDHSNIRFDPSQEPTGALGDLSWYSMRAVVEYLRPNGPITTISTHCDRDSRSGAVSRVTGLIGFESGETATFSSGYAVGAAVMDFDLYGTAGVISMDDFVLDWHNSFFFKNPDVALGYSHRVGTNGRKDRVFTETPSSVAQDVLMVDRFAALASTPDPRTASALADASIRTQDYLDHIWASVQAG